MIPPTLSATPAAGTEVWAGAEALAAIAGHADVVVNGVVGFAGLPVTLAALNGGRRLADWASAAPPVCLG